MGTCTGRAVFIASEGRLYHYVNNYKGAYALYKIHLVKIQGRITRFPRGQGRKGSVEKWHLNQTSKGGQDVFGQTPGQNIVAGRDSVRIQHRKWSGRAPHCPDDLELVWIRQ